MTSYDAMSTVVLAALLYFPVSRMVWVLSVRRLERRRGEHLDEKERIGQRNRARFIAVLITLPFSALFNLWIHSVSA